MKLSNNVYNFIKWFALAFVPALEVLILTVGKIWGLPYYDNIGATVAAVGVFLAAVIGVSSKTYYDDIAAENYEGYEDYTLPEIEEIEEDPALLDDESEVE